MSQETRKWLSENVLVGFTGKRGNAWHWKMGDDNHYDGAIPIADVEQRLFNWEPVSETIHRPNGDVIPGRQSIVHSDSGHVMGVFKSGYEAHPYRQWLLTNVSNILDSGLGIGSAGLLKGGAVAWVSVEVPESMKVTTSHGPAVEFRPNLIACTSFDGSIATTYKRIVTHVVCDNTMNVGLSESGQVYKVKHTSRSLLRIGDARQALNVVFETADDFSAAVEELLNKRVNDRTFDRFIETYVPIDHDWTKMAITKAHQKRDALYAVYDSDDMARMWRGTAFGVVQAVNTWNQHYSVVRQTATQANRIERNMYDTIRGTGVGSDDGVMAALEMALAAV